MYLQQIATTEFVLLQALWTVKDCRQLIERLKPSHVIVHRMSSQEVYYLLTVQEVLHLLIDTSDMSSILEALEIHKYAITPALEGSTDAEIAPDQCIVLENGQLLGFFDAHVLPQLESLRIRGNDNDGTTKANFILRSLVAELPEKVQLDKVFSLLVSISASPKPDTGTILSIALPLGSTIDILVQPKRGVTLEGKGEDQLVVSSEEETLPIQFKLRGVTLGPGQLRVLAFHEGQPLGALTLKVTVLEASNPRDAQRDDGKRSIKSFFFEQGKG